MYLSIYDVMALETFIDKSYLTFIYAYIFNTVVKLGSLQDQIESRSGDIALRKG